MAEGTEVKPAPEAGTEAASKGSKGIEKLVHKIPGGWVTVGIGAGSLIIAVMTYQAMTNSGGTATLTSTGTPTAVTDQGNHSYRY